MTKPEIEKLIACIDDYMPRYMLVNDDGCKGVGCILNDLYTFLRKYPVESEKTCGPDYEAMYTHCAEELAKAQERIASIQFDMHNLSIEHAYYTGAVAAMETIFGRKFEPQR